MKSYAPVPMIPGPVSLHPLVLQAMQADFPSGQVDDEFLFLYAETGRKLAGFAETKNDVVLMTGEGMLALWGALKSCLSPGDKVVSVGTGVFGDGIGEMAKSIGCDVVTVSLPYDSTIGCDDSLEKIEEAIKLHKPKMLTAVHCETPSGTLNPLIMLGKMKKEYNIPLFYVDAVASFAGVSIQADEWGIDLLLGGSQKCLSAPPSMSFVFVSDVAWEIMAQVGYQGYDSLLPFKNIQQDGRCPYTPYWHGVSALHAAVDLLLVEGKDVVFKRHNDVALYCRNELKNMGIKLFPTIEANQSPTVTAAMIPVDIDWKDWQQRLKKRGLIVTGSFGPMAGKVFRLGHMGTQANMNLMQQALQIIHDALS